MQTTKALPLKKKTKKGEREKHFLLISKLKSATTILPFGRKGSSFVNKTNPFHPRLVCTNFCRMVGPAILKIIVLKLDYAFIYILVHN